MKKIIAARAHHSLVIAWWICTLAALFYTYEYMLRIEPGVMVENLRFYFGLSAGSLGLLASMYYWGYTPLQLVVGPLIDYFGARRVLISAILICAMGTFLFGDTHSYFVASIARFLVGVGSAFAFVGTLKLGADWLPRRYFSFFTGACTALGMFGAIFGETIMGWMVDHLGWKPVIWDSVWLGCALVGVFLFFVYEKHDLLGKEHHVEPLSPAILGNTLLLLMRQKMILQAGFIGCFMYLSLSLFAEQWGNVYIQKVLHVNAQTASYFVDMVFLGWLIGSPISGLISEMIKSRRLIMFWGSVSSLIVFIPIIITPFTLSKYVLALLLFLFGLFSSGQVNCFAVARDMVETQLAATAAGLMNAMVMISGMLIQPLFGYYLNWLSADEPLILGVHSYTAWDFQRALYLLPFFIILSCITAWRMHDSYEIGGGHQWRQRIRL